MKHRQCRFYREEETKSREGPGRKICSSSRPPTEVCGFHQTLKKPEKQTIKKKKPNQSEEKPLKPRGLLRDLQV